MIRFFRVQKLRYTVTAVIQLLTFHFVVLCESIIFVVKFNSSILQFFLHRVFGYRGIILFPWVARMYDRDVNGRESKSDTSFCNSQAYCLAYRTRQFSRKFGVGLFPCAPPQTSCTVREWTSSIETSSNSLVWSYDDLCVCMSTSGIPHGRRMGSCMTTSVGWGPRPETTTRPSSTTETSRTLWAQQEHRKTALFIGDRPSGRLVVVLFDCC